MQTAIRGKTLLCFRCKGKTGAGSFKKKGGIVKGEKAYHMLTRRGDRHRRLKPT